MLQKFFVLLCIVSLRCTTLLPYSYPLIIDHDGGIDDVISVMLQFLNDEKRVEAITVAPADCYPKPAAFVMTHVKDLFLPADKRIPLGISSNEGVNPFPDIWRDDAWGLARMSLWRDEKALNDFSLNTIQSSLNVLSQVLAESQSQLDILETGPCTNLAEVFLAHPEFKTKIHRIYIMGGAVYVKGNVEQKGHDGSAEWNIYNNPAAFLDILRTGIPITLVSLDATQYTPIRQQFMSELEKHLPSRSYQLVYESLNLIEQLIKCGQYMFWDTLTSIVSINPDIVKTKKVKINVILDGPSMGRTIECAAACPPKPCAEAGSASPGEALAKSGVSELKNINFPTHRVPDACVGEPQDENGYEVDLAVWANQELFEKTVLDILAKG